MKIDLRNSYVGEMKAWMKKNPKDSTYRSFDITGNRYLNLTPEKTSDYYFNGELIEAVEGKWYFDVELFDTGDPSSKRTIYTGIIFFENDITDSEGIELTPSEDNGLLKIESFIATDGQTSFTVSEGKIADNGFLEVNVNGQQWNSRNGQVSFPGGNVSANFATGEITFHIPLQEGDQTVIKYS